MKSPARDDIVPRKIKVSSAVVNLKRAAGIITIRALTLTTETTGLSLIFFANIEENENITNAIKLMKENNVPILSIVDNSGKCSGTISEREVLLQLGTVNNKSSDIT